MRHVLFALATGCFALHGMSDVRAQGMPLPSFQPGERWTYVESGLLPRQETARFTEAVHSVAAAAGVWLHRTGPGNRTHWGRATGPWPHLGHERWGVRLPPGH